MHENILYQRPKILSGITGPGPQDILAGDSTLGFYGEFSASEFLTGTVLASAIGLTAGTAVNNTTPWLKFSLDGKTLFIPKTAYRCSLSWDSLYQVGAVYGTSDNGLYPTGTPRLQNAKVTFLDRQFIVRLLKGADADPSVTASSYYVTGTHNSEWSRLFYAIVSDDPNLNGKYTGPKLASYTEADLQMRWIDATQTPGSYNWCQETPASYTTYRDIRGYYGPSRFQRGTSSSGNSNFGWRPCLELIIN